ncbi:MAG TPA: DUF4214 domain-containing protein [Opitutaceae bacterium]|nr:DUF4214 domain-containing protein [Opitutaceae bacterium]
MRLPAFGLVALLSFALAGCIATAQPAAERDVVTAPPSPPPPPPPGPRVVFFSEPNFHGESFVVAAGAGVDNLADLPRGRGSWDRAISSFRVEGVATVVAYADSRFRGDHLEVSGSVPDLVTQPRGRDPRINWNRAISSLRVVPARERPGGPEGAYDARTAENVVRQAYREILGREPDPDGLRSYRDKLMHEGWTAEMLRAHLKTSGEAKAINPDDVITRAYREILKREPDPDGLQHYRQLITRDGWTEPQVRADLLRSAEESATAVRNLVTRAYREVLGRDPDPAGLASYEKAVREKGWTDRQVREALMKSDEYRQKHAGR